MKLSLTVRFFAALFGTSSVMIALVVAWAGWALNTGFSIYLSTTALAGMNHAAQSLQSLYAAHGDWSGIAGRPDLWAAILHQDHPGGPPPGDRPPGNGWNGPPGPPPDWAPGFMGGPGGVQGGGLPPGPPPGEIVGHLRERVELVDAAGKIIMGGAVPFAHPARRTLTVQGKTVGVLLLDAGPLPGGIEADFLEARLQDLYVAGAVAVALSGAAALLLARQILVPVRQVAAAARKLARGDFTARLPGGPRDELGALMVDFNALAEALDSAEQSRRHWVADTSHELRTPLAVLRAQVEALQDGVQPVTPAALGVLHGEILRMTKLVNDLQELSRADAGVLALQQDIVAPAAIMGEILASFSSMLERAGLMLEAGDLATCRALAYADPDRLRQVFANLVENAIRYTDPGGIIRVRAISTAQAVSVRVEDSAPSVPAAKLGRLFDRFYRAENSRNRRTGGSGLGLSISKAIVEAHGGTIAAEPSALGGLAVTVSLPAQQEPG